MHNRKIARFQGQIDTGLKNFPADLELGIKKLFAVLHIQSHLIGAGIRKGEGVPAGDTQSVLTSLAFLHLRTVHDLRRRPFKCWFKAQKDTSTASGRPNGTGGLFIGASSAIWDGALIGSRSSKTTAPS